MTALKLPATPTAPAWQRVAPLAVVLAALLWMFRDTAAAMVAIWSRSDTFAHGFLVPPIVLWLAWRKREALAAAPVAASPLWLLPLATGGFLWLLGELAGAQAVTQGALVLMAVCCVPAVLGTRVARILAFPLLFLFFCVPVGEFLIEPMMERTADFTVAALRLTGIPVYREGLQFVIPSGNWSVVAACSGVRYLIASLMVGTLFAYINFHSSRRRLAFVAVSLLVPIVANWLRAYIIVMLGHLSSNKLAAGADHLVYGWVFFGVVILLMFMIGARFMDAPPPRATLAQSVSHAAAPAVGAWVAAASVVALLLALQVVQQRLQAGSPGLAPQLRLPAELAAPGGGEGWQRREPAITRWVPAYRHTAATASATFHPVTSAGPTGAESTPDSSGTTGTSDSFGSFGTAGSLGAESPAAVGLWLGHYREQSHERKMITSSNQLVEEASLAWHAVPQPPARIQVGGASIELRASLLRSPADPKVSPAQRLLVWRVYRVAGRLVAGDAEAALWLALQRMAGNGDQSTVWMFYTATGEDTRGAEQRLSRFVTQHIGTLVSEAEAASTTPR